MDMSKLYCLTDSQNKLYLNAIIDTFSKATNYNANNLFSIMILFNQNNKPVKKTKVKVVITIIKLLKKMYINQLYKCFIVNMPKCHKIIYSLVKPFIGKKTRDKIIFKKFDQISLL